MYGFEKIRTQDVKSSFVDTSIFLFRASEKFRSSTWRDSLVSQPQRDIVRYRKLRETTKNTIGPSTTMRKLSMLLRDVRTVADLIRVRPLSASSAPTQMSSRPQQPPRFFTSRLFPRIFLLRQKLCNDTAMKWRENLSRILNRRRKGRKGKKKEMQRIKVN